MASDRFQAKYDELDQLSGMFSNGAGQVGETMGKLKQAIENIRDKWIGEGSQKFQQEMESEVLPALGKLQSALNEGASRTKQMAQLIHDHEQQASNLFKPGAIS
ncbi:MAG: WXG100 family type VII secretion target [Anaerolineaceae bacterium]|jgi:WXG100 family type VII secretion target